MAASQQIDDILSAIERNSPPVISREEAARLTGGTITPKSLANLDSLGLGITPRIKIGRKVAYPREAFIEFLRNRTEIF